jgi:hypothetical protein
MAKGLRIIGACLAASLVGGCVERKLTLLSDPPGALAYLNDQEVGRTPVTRSFNWYGNYEVILRKDGYQTLKTHSMVSAPIYEIPPLDFFSEVSPFNLTDQHTLQYKLTPAPPSGQDTEGLLKRAEQMKQDNAAGPKAQPTTQPEK